MTRKNKQPIDMSTLLKSSSGTLAQITQKTNSLTIIASIVRQICPDLPADAWHVGNLSGKSILIEVKSSAWGQRLQFERNNISQALKKASDGLITQIDIKVSPFLNKAPAKKEEIITKSQFISDKTAAQLTEVAKNAPESLKIKLLALAKLAENRQSKKP